MSRRIFIAMAAILLSSQVAQAWETEGLRLRARLIGRYEIRDRDEQVGRWTDTLSLNRARLDGRWTPIEGLKLNLEFDLADEFAARDAYVRYEVHDAFHVSAGHFKKPFSRLRMTSRWKLPVPRRGLVNRRVINDTPFGGFGGRDVGGMISGRVGEDIRFRYFVGVFDGGTVVDAFFKDPDDLDADNATHRDYVARLQLRPVSGLVIAANANHKRASYILAPGNEKDRGFTILGADIRWTAQDFRVQIESAWGDNPNAAEGHKALGVHGIVSYRIPLNETLRLTPALMVEYFDPDDVVKNREATRYAGAVSLEVGTHTRIYLAAEGGSGEYSWEAPEYITEEEEVLAEQRPRAVPTRIYLQLNVSL